MRLVRQARSPPSDGVSGSETKLCSMETLSHSKVLWVLAALCAVPVCRAATEGSTNQYESRRVEPIAHPTGSTQKFLSAIGSSNFENAAGRFNEHSYEASATKPAAFVSVPESTRDAVRAELDNLSLANAGEETRGSRKALPSGRHSPDAPVAEQFIIAQPGH